MKHIVVLIIIGIGFTSCHRLYLTESYLKNNVEKHTVGESSSIKAYMFEKNIGYDGNSTVELLGYKYKNKKGLLIGVTHSLNVRFQNQNILLLSNNNVIELSLADCELILQLKDSIDINFKKIDTKTRERKSFDYTINKNLIISYSNIGTGKMQTNNSMLDLWIKGQHYGVNKILFYDKLKQFIVY